MQYYQKSMLAKDTVGVMLLGWVERYYKFWCYLSSTLVFSFDFKTKNRAIINMNMSNKDKNNVFSRDVAAHHLGNLHLSNHPTTLLRINNIYIHIRDLKSKWYSGYAVCVCIKRWYLYDRVSPRTSLSITKKVFKEFLSIKSYRNYVFWILKCLLIGVFRFVNAIPHGRGMKRLCAVGHVFVGGSYIVYCIHYVMWWDAVP